TPSVSLHGASAPCGPVNVRRAQLDQPRWPLVGRAQLDGLGVLAAVDQPLQAPSQLLVAALEHAGQVGVRDALLVADPALRSVLVLGLEVPRHDAHAPREIEDRGRVRRRLRLALALVADELVRGDGHEDVVVVRGGAVVDEVQRAPRRRVGAGVGEAAEFFAALLRRVGDARRGGRGALLRGRAAGHFFYARAGASLVERYCAARWQ
ncbi:unnamed protein product, partial [Pelagomonas calceolata]